VSPTPPLEELVNTLEVEAIARHKLDEATFALIAGSNRAPFERITFRPRMMVNATQLDLRLSLFGTEMFAPIIAGPVEGLARFHADAHAALATGALDANAVFVVAHDGEFPVTKAHWWYQTGSDVSRVPEAAERGAKAVMATEWRALEALRPTTKLPLILKGVLSLEDAMQAASGGTDGIVLSNYTGTAPNALADPMTMLPAIADAVGGRIPVLIDGSFRRGSDIMMALAQGAKAVLVARPVAWGLAAYGGDGVRAVLEMLQTELARTMAMCGKPHLAQIDRNVIHIHSR
jgi:isopentenyl diphosphate isomerase/L-lactate dehydrogenase-like FMN-dependent dehydrogenase